MKKQALFISILLLMTLSIKAQDFNCGTERLEMEYSMEAVEQILKRQAPAPTIQDGDELIVPVVFYIYDMPHFDVNAVQAQLDMLNAEFDDDIHYYQYNITLKFCLATTEFEHLPLPTPYSTTMSSVIQYGNKGVFWIEDVNVGPSLDPFTPANRAYLSTSTGSLDDDHYLRIYVYDTGGNGSQSTIIPQFVTSPDKMVILTEEHTNVASNPSYGTGKVLVHEVGHYMGLFHVFHGGCSGSSPYNCVVDGDKICDTAPLAYPANTNNCETDVSTWCPGYYVPDRRLNHMDYKEDNCRTIFTYDQINVMGDVLFFGPTHSILTTAYNIEYTNPDCSEICEGCEEYNITHYKTALQIEENIDLNESYLYPNPTKSDVNIVIPSSVNDEFTISIVSSFGQVLIEETISSQETETKYTFSSTELSIGIYFVKITSKSGETKVLKFYKAE